MTNKITIVTGASSGIGAATVKVLVKNGYKSISPGYVDTEIVKVNGFLEYEDIAAIEKVAPRLHAEDVADAILYVASTPSHVQITELTIRPVGEAV
ncbi:dehydrogenase/reductase sdr family member 11 [Holotrichia oblita]|uniref:Dehydrogenase/reductase sdr family member 11 n=1 Tax=Holotrichia oblita TaxID=644536 RepID=A0ACB9SIE2_HOLOL|nr:dehydrogenase/reductase sdr family member 11 [Holotrichia oblita]